jgi:hypothetical protein
MYVSAIMGHARPPAKDHLCRDARKRQLAVFLVYCADYGYSSSIAVSADPGFSVARQIAG